MSLKLKSKKLQKLIFLITCSLILLGCLFLLMQDSVFSDFDLKIQDKFYKKAVAAGRGPKPSSFPQIKYVTITDTTYTYTQKNYLDRLFLSKINNVLTELSVQAIAYDILFPMPTSVKADQAFARSIEDAQSVYLPIGIAFSKTPSDFEWEKQDTFHMLQTQYLKAPVQKGIGRPFFGTRALMQYDPFAKAAFNSGHISAHSDNDGALRHMPMIIKIEEGFFPTLSLSMFLDYAGVPFEKAIVVWGRHITIPALEESYLEKDVVIPIDNKGLAVIPYCETWAKGFEEIPSHVLVQKFKDKTIAGNLADIFEGNFVFIGDISVGISDLGNTPLENNVPLIVSHAAMLNGLLTNTFYTKWEQMPCLLLVAGIGILLGLSSLVRTSWPLYAMTLILLGGVAMLTWFQFINFKLFPVVTVTGLVLFMSAGLVIFIQIATQRDRAFIKGVFATYVPDKIVDHLLVNPDLLTLGGEMREVTLMMTDIRGYTALSSNRTPQEVILILNRYYEKMFDIIMAYDGIINEIIGDGILAFFGAPQKFDDHPAKAVACALAMQNAMEEVNAQNAKDDLPSLEMGIGINTGEVVVGNVGSRKRAQYGVTGNEVNLAGRTESYTVGGQVLVTSSVFERLKSLLTIKKTMRVDMKGMAHKVDLYDVSGICAPFDIYLKEKEKTLSSITPPLPVDLFLLDKKIVSKEAIFAQITAIGPSNATIFSDKELHALDNVRMHLHQDRKSEQKAQIYAKVDTVQQTKNGFKAVLDFTSVTAAAKIIITTVLKPQRNHTYSDSQNKVPKNMID
ncbi:MAG: adenylate/guanylate cyclase domain-containing protein [Desulfobacteraceae bacterium]|nr:adenylate/guanylate cyclase domain-containing protein [Desulfobacteraceae bacterium]